MLGPEVVINDTDFLKIGEFNLGDFLEQATRKVAKACSDANSTPEWASTIAVVSYNRCRAVDCLTIELDDKHSWGRVEIGINNWLNEKKKGVTVRVSIKYKNILLVDTQIEDKGPAALTKV